MPKCVRREPVPWKTADLIQKPFTLLVELVPEVTPVDSSACGPLQYGGQGEAQAPRGAALRGQVRGLQTTVQATALEPSLPLARV